MPGKAVESAITYGLTQEYGRVSDDRSDTPEPDVGTRNTSDSSIVPYWGLLIALHEFSSWSDVQPANE
jgi:hypothetical protein